MAPGEPASRFQHKSWICESHRHRVGGLFIPHLRHDKPMSERKWNTKSANQNTKGANILLGLRPHLSIRFAPFVFCFALFVLNQVSSSTQSTSLPNTPEAFSLFWRICVLNDPQACGRRNSGNPSSLRPSSLKVGWD